LGEVVQFWLLRFTDKGKAATPGVLVGCFRIYLVFDYYTIIKKMIDEQLD